MKVFTSILILLFATSAYASTSLLVIAKGEGDVPVSVKLDLKADYIAIPLHISCDEKDPTKRLLKIHKAYNLVTEKVSKTDYIDIKKGYISLSTEELSSFSFSSPYNGSTVDLYLISPLKVKQDIFFVTQNLINFISNIPEVDDVNFRIGTTTLGIINPEQYRKELAKLIAEDAEKLKSELGGFQTIKISGLESPVLVSQKDDSDVTLYMYYKLSIEK